MVKFGFFFLFNYKKFYCKTIFNLISCIECKLTSVDQNLIDLIWDQRPQKKIKEIITLDISLVGKTIRDKYLEILKEMKERNVQALVVSALDEVACKKRIMYIHAKFYY